MEDYRYKIRLAEKILLLIFFIVFICIYCSQECLNFVCQNKTTNNSTNTKIIFQDEFNQSERIPDKKNWTLPSGYINGPFAPHSYDQAYVENGKLILKATKNEAGAYKTGSLWTNKTFSFTYGKVECSAKIKTIKGGHASIWLLSYPLDRIEWKVEGEIDIMEQYDNNKVVNSTIHSYYTLTLGHKKDPVNHSSVECNVAEFNTYAVEWTPEKVEFSVNGKALFSYPNLHLPDETTMRQWPFNKPFFVILDFSIDKKEIVDSELPGIIEIDWIRISSPKLFDTAFIKQL